MVGTRPRTAFLYRTKWTVPVIAVALAAVSAGLGQLAQSRILAEPDQPITFIVEDGLPYGITQDTVDAAASGRAGSYEPFTILVVERELTWEESQHGELPQDADVMLSVGIDEADPDLILPDARRASVAKLAAQDDWQPSYNVSVDIRQSFLNNLTQGLGPSAVVGAAMTAASGAFDGGTRSPVFWVSIAALPALVGILMTALWARHLARERARRRVFSSARLELARVALELDLLHAHVLIAGAELDRGKRGDARDAAREAKQQLNDDWTKIRRESLELAHEEQALTREILDPRAHVHERGAPDEPMDLSTFAARTAALRRRADALVAASSLRVGHAAGGAVLGQIALSSTLAIDEVLERRDLLTDTEREALSRQRAELLALLHEAETAFGADDGADVIARHAALMTRWRNAESRLSATLTKIERRVRRSLPRGTTSHVAAGVLAQRLEDRTRVATAGRAATLDELRASLDLAPRKSHPPGIVAERVLLVAEARDGSTSAAPQLVARADRLAPDFTPVAVIGVPLVVALIAGFAATSAMDAGDATYGRTLVGDQPLASLELVGDPALLPDYADPSVSEYEPPNLETLSLDSVREKMAWNAERDAALLPERLDLHVALLPMEEYVTVRPHEDDGTRIQIDFFDVLDAYTRIKDDVEAVSPETIDATSGEVRPGHAILPLWVGEDGSYGVGLPLTGTLSTGVDSDLGSYYFIATEPSMWNQPGEDSTVSAGSLVASRMSDLGSELEHNNLREANLSGAALFWTVALATWTGVQALAMVVWSIAQLVLRNAGSRRGRRELRDLRARLNAMALGLDLSRLDAVAVLGAADGHGGRSAEADQQLYETMLFTAWREVQTLEELPRGEQRGPEWRARVERMRSVIEALSERDAAVAERALDLVRTYA